MEAIEELVNKYVEIKRIGEHGKYVILNTNIATLEEEIEKLLNLHVSGSKFKLGQKVYSAWRDTELSIEAVGFNGCYLRDHEDGEVEWHDDDEIYLQ